MLPNSTRSGLLSIELSWWLEMQRVRRRGLLPPIGLDVRRPSSSVLNLFTNGKCCEMRETNIRDKRKTDGEKRIASFHIDFSFFNPIRSSPVNISFRGVEKKRLAQRTFRPRRLLKAELVVVTSQNKPKALPEAAANFLTTMPPKGAPTARTEPIPSAYC